MISLELLKKEAKQFKVLFFVFVAILSLYTIEMVFIYDPKTLKALESFQETMPEIMNAIGAGNIGSTTLTSHLGNFLYNFILILFPLIFIVLLGNRLVVKYVENSSLIHLLNAPITRLKFIRTQIFVMVTSITLLVLYVFFVQIIFSNLANKGEIEINKFILLNLGLLAVLLFMGSIVFLFSCIFNSSKYSLFLGAGIPILGFIIKMLSEASEKLADAKYFTFFYFFNVDNVLALKNSSILGIIILFALSIILFALSLVVFNKKDLSI